MTRMLAALSLPLLLAACNNPAMPERTEVFKSFGTTQCNPHEGRLSELVTELRARNVRVMAHRQADDGMMRIALCGAPDGLIGIFTIPRTQLTTARAAGFELYEGPK